MMDTTVFELLSDLKENQRQAEAVLLAASFHDFEFAYIYEGTLLVSCLTEDAAFALNRRQINIVNALQGLSLCKTIKRAKIEFPPDRHFLFDISRGAMLTTDSRTLSPFDGAALIQFLKDSDEDRQVLLGMFESQYPEYLIDHATDVVALGTRDIATAQDLLCLKRKLTIDNPITKYWDLGKLANYKRDISQAGALENYRWEAKGTASDGSITSRELKNVGNIRLLSFRGRLHRRVTVLEST